MDTKQENVPALHCGYWGSAACDAYSGPGTALNGVRSGQTGAGLACTCDNGFAVSAQKFVTASNCNRPVDLSSLPTIPAESFRRTARWAHPMPKARSIPPAT